MYSKLKDLIIAVLVVSLLVGPFSLLTVEATEENEISNNFSDYNCYAYAIGRFEQTTFYWHGDKSRYQPGDMYKSERVYMNYEDDVMVMANYVKSDLIAMGYAGESVIITSTMPNNLTPSQNLICLRMGPTDYHFMKYDLTTNAWYQKFGDGPIIEYTDNNGIPSNERIWCSTGVDENGNPIGSGYVYDGEILYILYNKMQLVITESAIFSKNITVKGGNNNHYSGKDVVYELIIPELCYYSIRLTSSDANFNYELYSYNMYNGDYILYPSGSSIQNGNFYEVNLSSPLPAGKYYLRMDFGRSSDSDKTILLVANSTPHSYTDHYEQSTDSSHEAYCWCGEHISRSHSLEYYMHNGLQHKVACYCGYTYYEPHVYATSAQVKICLRCGQMAGSGGILLEASGEIIYLTESGSYLRPDGIVMLSDVDVELYLAGELDINALIRQATNPAV